MVSGQQHSILCWIVADAPESICSPCAMQASQAQAVQPLHPYYAHAVLSSSTLDREAICALEPLKLPLDPVPGKGLRHRLFNHHSSPTTTPGCMC